MRQDSIPLSALRARLDHGSAATSWTIDPDGVSGRALMMPAAAPFTVVLTLTKPIEFAAQVMLLPHDWRDGRGAVRASVTIDMPGQDSCELWAGLLRSSTMLGASPRGLAVRVRVPPQATMLRLRIDAGPPGDRAVARAIWLEPTVSEPGVPFHTPRSGVPRAIAASPTPPTHPLLSVIMPVHDPPPRMLREAIGSVRTQTLADWELCLVDDGSRNREVVAELQRAAAEDHRIRLRRHEQARGIAKATNTALDMASGEYIALLDHDDTLAADALQHVSDRVTAEPDLDMLYSDEDILLDGRQIWVHLKPDWSPDTLRTNGYTCHLGVYRSDLVREIGGFRSEFDGSQDVDMIFRLTERSDRIGHIPLILYHWRAHAGSTSGADAKPYAYVAGRKAIAAHLERTGLDADVGYGPPGLYRVAHRVDSALSIDIVLAVQTTQGLAEAAASWLSQAHRNCGVVLAAPPNVLGEASSALVSGGFAADRIRSIAAPGGDDLTSALAAAAGVSRADHLLLMQRPGIGLTHDWLLRLLGYSAQPGIDAAGPVLVGPDGRILDAGIALPDGIALHLLHGTRSSMDRFFGYGTSVYNVLAVSGMLATPRVTFERLGLRAELRGLALAEYCLRCRGRIVIVPDARLRATGPDTTVNDLSALRELQRTWAAAYRHDPYYNPRYRTDRGDFEPIRD